MDNPELPLRHPANASLIAHFASRPKRRAGTEEGLLSVAAHDTKSPYDGLGSHPDHVSRLWDDLDSGLPARCRWIVRATPVLAHPQTGVIFGFTGGTTYALRLPHAELEAALAVGAEQVHHFPAYPELGVSASTLDLRDIGPDWIFGAWRREESSWCLAAFDAAARGWPAAG